MTQTCYNNLYNNKRIYNHSKNSPTEMKHIESLQSNFLFPLMNKNKMQ